MLVIYVLASDPLLVSDSTREDGTAATVAAIALEPLLVLGLAGLVVFVVRRFVLRRTATFWQCVSSVPVMLVCLLFAAVSRVGRAGDAHAATQAAEASVFNAGAGIARPANPLRSR